jgi:hypothetical protein
VIASGAVALGIGTALALGAALVVLGPLWTGAGHDGVAPGDGRPVRTEPGASSPAGPAARVDGVSAVEALREIEFDRETGKLADEDYAALKAAYTREALAELRAQQAPPAAPAPTPVMAGSATSDDPVEVALRAYRARRGEGGALACPEHGQPAESDAVFCPTCGRFLAAHCPACGAGCGEPGQRFCGGCGHSLAPAELTPAAA